MMILYGSKSAWVFLLVAANTVERVVSQGGCTLCEDGSMVPNPDFQIVPQANCAGVEAFVNASEPPETCPARQAAAGVYCGCDNPIAVQNVCRICGGDTWLPDPGRAVNASGFAENIQCGTAEYTAYNSSNCTEYQTIFGDDCCMSDPTMTGTDAPAATDPPTTMEASWAPVSSGGPMYITPMLALSSLMFAGFW